MDSSTNQNKIYLEREIDVNEISYLLLKNKRLIIVSGILIAIFSFVFSSLQTKVYRGKFKIMVNNQSPSFNTSSLLGKIIGSDSDLFQNNSRNNSQNIETTIEIIRGPVVLKSVYDYVQSNKSGKSLLPFEVWVNKLKIDKVRDTSILEVSYFDNDRNLILNTLERIKIAYKKYSTEKTSKEINASYEFLNSQYEIAKNKAIESTQKLNKFAIQHGLGNFDGIPLLSPDTNKDYVNEENQSSEPFDSNNRYFELFQTLQKLETEYTRLSSMLNEESSILKNLENQIEKFKTSLERPNKILLEFNDLIRESSNDFRVVQTLDSQLRSAKLERVKKQNSWEILTEPLVEKKPVTWSNKKSTVFGFGIGLFLGILFAIIKGLASGIIYTKSSFLLFLPYKYLFSMSFERKLIDDDLFSQIIQSTSTNEKTKTGVLYLVNKLNPKINQFIDELDLQLKNRNVLTSCDIDKFSKCKKVILVAFADTISQKELEEKIDFLKLQEFEITGWIFVK